MLRTLVGLCCLLVAPALAAAEEKDLAECLAIALANKPSLRAAGAAVDAARYRVRQAASQYLPQIGATHDVQRRKTSLGVSTGTDLGMGGGSGFDPGPREFTFYSTGVSLSQTLFDFGRNLAEIRAAQARRRSAEADRDTELEVVVFEVKQSYFNLLAAQRLAGVAEQTVRQNRTLLEEADARYEVGMAARFDQTRARVQLATTELDQLTSRNNVALARETLRNALGLDGPLDFEISDTLEVTEVEVDEAQALAVAYAQRPELRSFDEQRAAVAQTIVALQRDYLPALAGNGSYNWSGSDELQESWRLGASINLSIFNGGLTTAQIGEQSAILAELDYRQQTLRQSIALEVRQAALSLAQAKQSIAVAGVGRDQARENLDIALGRYRGGVGNIIELTDAQTAHTSADASYVQALYNHQIALASLERAMGKPATEVP